jgi:hypothetical protein
MFSWLAFFGAALAIWLLLRGSAAETTAWVQRVYRAAIAFCLYAGFLYILKWNPFWRVMPASGSENRSATEGFLILISTLVWLIVTVRVLVRGLSISDARSGALEKPGPRKKNTRWGLTLTDLILFYHSFKGR